MLDPESQSLKDMLLASGIIPADQLAEVEEEYERSAKPLKELLINYDMIMEDQLLEMIATNLGTEVVDLTHVEIEKSVIDMVPGDTARMLGVVPLSYDGTSLTVTVRNPLNYQIGDELRFMLNKDIITVVSPEAQIDRFLEKYYPMDMGSMQDMLAEMELQDGLANLNENDLENAASEAPIIKFVDAVLYQAVKDKASDIHFEPFEKEFKIRYRIDGALYEMAPATKNLAIPVISRVKIMSSLNISERRKPQDGRIQLRVAGNPIDLRVSTLPTQFGESVVLRVLDRSVVNLDLDMLGINENVLHKIRDIISMPNGIFIITGPTGSGKTTTLYSALKEINKVEDKILTAEDPVEYDLEGIVQVPINDAVGMTFAAALRAFLRQDPDIIMLGETRDLESAEMAVQASLTGHLVFTTLHTNDAAGAITRLVDMGVEPFLITSSLIGVLGQRLIRKVCNGCKTAFTPTDEDLAALGLKRSDIGDNKFYYGKGCNLCQNTGYKGRKAITELLVMDSRINDLVLQNAPTIVIRDKARELGMETMREDGIRAILNGDTTMEEVLKYT
ncbi:MAG: type II/IV secretion system protein [Lentisphaeria bacterium]|nr:type II/IV secretion system protein [Lentisphaerota bacterium]MBO5681452.1 type II/IV secretion system protein [Lentisphaeria bacterium]MBO5695164.1 type II/IV secretion system protein [Lentisphaeria bacterium]MBR4884430.1 type II/IV secretion system protein [Lentisphaeria bacterium]